MATNPTELQMQTAWQINPMSTPLPVNQIMLQEGVATRTGPSDEFYITLGHVTPPAIMPGPDGSLPEGLNGMVVPIVGIGHFAISYERLREFRDVIDQFVDSVAAQR